MASGKINIVVSRGQSQNPKKRSLEDSLVEALESDSGLNIYIVPNLYDVTSQGETVEVLRAMKGDMVVFSWSYGRVARWILQRNGIHGTVGEVLLTTDDDSDGDDEQADQSEVAEDVKQRVADGWEQHPRKIYCVNFQSSEDPEPFVVEARRIIEQSARDERAGWTEGSAQSDLLKRYRKPSGAAARIEEDPGRRWYPVIDFSRCTNCMECVDFCLFGVYGVDTAETILVEQPDNCRKGCPACSRVCPENAIMFPQHKTPVIAGAPADSGTMKIDLSRLFGAPDKNAMNIAARERDEQLELAGRSAAGASAGVAKRQADKTKQPKDGLDDLLDELDDLDL